MALTAGRGSPANEVGAARDQGRLATAAGAMVTAAVWTAVAGSTATAAAAVKPVAAEMASRGMAEEATGLEAKG